VGVNRKPSYPPSGGASFSPSTRPVYRGGASAAYPLAFATLGITAAGYVYDGLVSRAWTDNGATTLASASGSDTAAVYEDMSGNENHSIQTTTANRPVWYSDGTITSLKHGLISGVNRGMVATTVPAAMSVRGPRTTYAVTKVASASAGVNVYLAMRLRLTGGTSFSSVMKLGDDPSGMFRLYSANSPTVAPTVNGGPAGGGAPGVLLAKSADNGSASIYAKSGVDFSTGDTGTGSIVSEGNAEQWWTFGGGDDGTLVVQTCFLMDVAAVTTAEQDAIIKAYIKDNFAAWAGN